MAVVNRDLDPSQQALAFNSALGPLATGVTTPICVVPYPATLSQIKTAAFGISGTPTVVFSIQRFIVGSGVTSYLGGVTTLTLQAAGTSGALSAVLASQGSTALNLQAGDVIMSTTGGSNAAVTGLAVSVVLKASQDIRQFFGATYY